MILVQGIVMLKCEHQAAVHQRWQTQVMASAQHKGLQSRHIFCKHVSTCLGLLKTSHCIRPYEPANLV